jgi:hypothetical protein
MDAINNPYLSELHLALPRLLALFDTDPVSPSFGEETVFTGPGNLLILATAPFKGQPMDWLVCGWQGYCLME